LKGTNPIASLFGHSPFKPVQKHMVAVSECVAEVPGLFEALIANDKAGIVKAKDIIFAKEHEADAIKNGLRAQLPKSLFMPVDRRDLLDLLGMQDSIADTAQDIAGLLVERDMQVPPGMAADLRQLVARCVDAVNQAGLLISELDELVETGFGGREAETVRA
jgi:predicted phosphate transport protein (TIGR00153 family)